MRAIPEISKGAPSSWSTTATEMMVISQFGKIIRMDTKSVRATGGPAWASNSSTSTAENAATLL